jgi:hypothetical protein
MICAETGGFHEAIAIGFAVRGGGGFFGGVAGVRCSKIRSAKSYGCY